MSVYIKQNSTNQTYTKNTWCILNPIEQSIKEKIERIGTPLKDWDININYGIKTGLNEAFIIDGAKKDELIAKDPRSAEIIRPILRGRDIKRYSYEFADKWLINTHNGSKTQKRVNVNNYPAIKEYLDKYLDKLRKRDDKGDTPYNLRCCAYMDDFNKQKIVWARLMRISKSEIDDFPRFALVPENYYTVDSLCFFTGENLSYLLNILNSQFAAYYFFSNIAILDNGGMQMRQQYIEQFPIPILQHTNNSKLLSDEEIYNLYGFSMDEIVHIKRVLRQHLETIKQQID